MAYPPGVFSVCLIYHEKYENQTIECQKAIRITFANRTLSDEWWRAGSKFLETLDYPDPRTAGYASNGQTFQNKATFQRTSPQWYHFYGGKSTHDLNWFLDEAWSKPFSDKMFILRSEQSVSGNEVGMVPQGFCSWMGTGTSHGPANGTEPISGKWYYIRSVVTPYEYWHVVHATHVLCASRTDRTRFRLDIIPTPPSPESNPDAPSSPGTVIIPSDAITLTVSKNNIVAPIINRDPERKFLYHGFHTDTDVTNARYTGRKLPANDRGQKWWLFKDFLDRFGVVRGNDTKNDTMHLLAIMQEGEGESWQLV